MLDKTAYLLVYHGSRDPRPAKEVSKLVQGVRHQMAMELAVSASSRATVMTRPPEPFVAAAALELAPLSLEETIAQEIVPKMQQQGKTHLQVIPLFLLPGVHVQEDIPNAILQAQEQVGHRFTIDLKSYLGSSPLMAQKIASTASPSLPFNSPSSAKIIISHGSRRKGGNLPIATLGKQLKANVAYWSVSPTLSEQVEALIAEGKQEIEIIPYFLFPGGITDAIAQQVHTLQTQFPQVRFEFGNPLSDRLSLADLILQEYICL
ncbi:sirohydrochlorin chelatase [Euhalothece natronophila Z-M001]|uniref:Sirohydrochlorin chelatase n=1 Tax=Euhalothece natronophila Z-M001 TaxID=522448 RepID=A0A5B8NJV3_9CHRO|nr:sirohydrochlorin chelatase [Euhalothece natronophila]QDZ39593.1 sirohydrochlorin chelatase [Euhalothece natronophila Z-M001]